MNLRLAACGALMCVLGMTDAGLGPAQAADAVPGAPHRESLRNVFGTYNAAPRRADGRVDLAFLLEDLSAIGANTYNWLIWHAATDWDDLKAFLPQARERRIRVWVTLVPPSESPPHAKNYSEPFRLDYERWTEHEETCPQSGTTPESARAVQLPDASRSRASVERPTVERPEPVNPRPRASMRFPDSGESVQGNRLRRMGLPSGANR